MFKLLFRLLGLVLAAIAFAFAIVDATRSLAAGAFILTPIGRAAALLPAARTGWLYEQLEKRLPASLLDPLAAVLPQLPVWLVFGLAAAALFRLSRPSPPEFGYSSR